MTRPESKFVKHIPCEACGSKDNNTLYDDGHTYCFGCNKRTSGKETNNTYTTPPVSTLPTDKNTIIEALKDKDINNIDNNNLISIPMT